MAMGSKSNKEGCSCRWWCPPPVKMTMICRRRQKNSLGARAQKTGLSQFRIIQGVGREYFR